MENKKMTKKDWFAVLVGIVEASDYADKDGAKAFIDRERELLDKKSGKSKETKTQKANAEIKAVILEVLAEQEKPVTISDLLADERLATYTEETKDGSKQVKMTNQKLSSLVKQLKDDKQVIRTEDKKKAFFSLPVEDVAEQEEIENETNE